MAPWHVWIEPTKKYLEAFAVTIWPSFPRLGVSAENDTGIKTVKFYLVHGKGRQVLDRSNADDMPSKVLKSTDLGPTSLNVVMIYYL